MERNHYNPTCSWAHGQWSINGNRFHKNCSTNVMWRNLSRSGNQVQGHLSLYVRPTGNLNFLGFRLGICNMMSLAYVVSRLLLASMLCFCLLIWQAWGLSQQFDLWNFLAHRRMSWRRHRDPLGSHSGLTDEETGTQRARVPLPLISHS